MQQTREMWLRSLGREDPLQKGMATCSVFLSGKSHGQRSLQSLDYIQSLGLQRVGHDWECVCTHTHTYTQRHKLICENEAVFFAYSQIASKQCPENSKMSSRYLSLTLYPESHSPVLFPLYLDSGICGLSLLLAALADTTLTLPRLWFSLILIEGLFWVRYHTKY